MNRQGRVLIVEDRQDWREELSEILEKAGYYTYSVTSAARALEQLNESIYHLMIIDVRLNEADQGNIDGLGLLNELRKRRLSEATKVIMVSAYGTKEQTRLAFKEYEVANFLYKQEFDQEDFLQSVRQTFTEKVRINLNLEIHWQDGSQPEQILRNLMLEGIPSILNTLLQSHMVTELEDLLCRLFYQAQSILVRPLTQGQSGACVLRVKPFYPSGGGQEVLVKFGDFRKIEQEYNNFKLHVQPFMGGGHNTSVLDCRRTPRLGGITYLLLGTANDKLMDFSEYYRQNDVHSITGTLDRLFHNTCGAWYAGRGTLQLRDLTADYQRLLSSPIEQLEQVLTGEFTSVQGIYQLSFRSLSNCSRTFTNPIVSVAGKVFYRATFTCTTHGDFNYHNLLVDDTGHVWLIDFQGTEQSHILRDVATLDSVIRFQMLTAGEATLEERLQMEEALCSIEHFSQIEGLKNSFSTQNAAVAKAYAIVLHIRSWARRLVELNPEDDISEYYIALLYTALNTLRFSSLQQVQREHALLSASLLADRLAQVEKALSSKQ